jgi:hypothetical protein
MAGAAARETSPLAVPEVATEITTIGDVETDMRGTTEMSVIAIGTRADGTRTEMGQETETTVVTEDTTTDRTPATPRSPAVLIKREAAEEKTKRAPTTGLTTKWR